MLPRTPLYRWLAVAAVMVVVYVYHPNLTGASLSAYTHSSTIYGGDLDPATWVKKVLKDHGIGPEISYAARTIQYIPDAKERLKLTQVEHNLLPDDFVDLKANANTPLPVGKTISVHVKHLSRRDDVDASGLIFGASTTFDRFNSKDVSPINEFKRWLTDGKGGSNGAGLILALFNGTDAEMQEASQVLANAGINATVVPSNLELDMPGRYVDLVNMLYNHPTSAQRKYFALIDDDTFFPYMSELTRTLFTYDYRKPYYIGTFTERVDWFLDNHVPMAYGGGGVFLTAPLAKQVSEANCLERREDGRYALDANQGDRLLYNCIHERTSVTITYQPRLNQMDQFGDPSGFYESGEQPLSVHHFKSWHRADVAKYHVVADACGEDCVLQRFQFKDNFIVSNGYSIAQYPEGIDFDPDQTEGTFDIPVDADHVGVTLGYKFGELRRSFSKTGKKLQWGLLDARLERDGKVKQIYKKSRSDERWVKSKEDFPERDSIIVLTWVP
ncbi:hypothetical protein HYALB_00000282 [Hymenoscyphus albidus]|uniref:Glycosyltransferase family 31 protein n=1 Tax=Hymenoscyphus albidus TaxID=595503 RepID=A0A9N9LRB0_9HELO|nr:hypothetical protein HYALB_00000282 [Hymenoscyphus albidus]